MAGHDRMDSTSARVPVPNYEEELNKPIKGLRIGVPKEYFAEGLDAEVGAAVEAAIARLGVQGAEIVPISLPHTPYAVPTYYVIATAEASANLGRYDGVPAGYLTPVPRTLAEMYQRPPYPSFTPQ